MDWTTAAVAFGSALLGAGLGALGAFLIQKSADDRELFRHRVGTVKAILGESRINALLIIYRLPSGADMGGTVSTTVWQRSNHDAAQFMADETYLKLISMYARLPVMTSLVTNLKSELEVDPTLKDLQIWADDIVELEKQLLELEYAKDFKETWARLPNLRQRFDEQLGEIQHHDETS